MPDMHIGLIGPLPPPSGGMANQTRQLARLLRSEGLNVELVQTNAPYKPGWIGKLPGIRALFRLLPYIWQLWRTAGRVELFHVMANSGWSWHLFAAPAVWVGALRGVPVVVNYRGGEAGDFFRESFRWVRPTLKRVSSLVVPTGFLADVFAGYGCESREIPNIIDVDHFSSRTLDLQDAEDIANPHIIVTRNLEPIYDIASALRAFERVHAELPDAHLTIAGSGPERDPLEKLAQSLGVSAAVKFTGRLDTADMARLYSCADIMLNPSRADNMPNSVLESLASGVPVVSTNVGGVPYLVTHDETAVLVSVGDDTAMASAMLRICGDAPLRHRLISQGIAFVQQFTWSRVRELWLGLYTELCESRHGQRLGA